MVQEEALDLLITYINQVNNQYRVLRASCYYIDQVWFDVLICTISYNKGPLMLKIPKLPWFMWCNLILSFMCFLSNFQKILHLLSTEFKLDQAKLSQFFLFIFHGYCWKFQNFLGLCGVMLIFCLTFHNIMIKWYLDQNMYIL
jgi:hypothetical protein